jgi:hypothetical protein
MATVLLQLSTRGKVNLTIRTQCIDPEIDPKIGDEIHLGRDTDDKHLYATVSSVRNFLLEGCPPVIICHDITPLALFIATSQHTRGRTWEFSDGDQEAWKSLQYCLARQEDFASLGW